jgi:hypothetical protein
MSMDCNYRSDLSRRGAGHAPTIMTKLYMKREGSISILLDLNGTSPYKIPVIDAGEIGILMQTIQSPSLLKVAMRYQQGNQQLHVDSLSSQVRILNML